MHRIITRVGQQLLRLDDEAGVRLFMIVSILLTLALLPVALTRTSLGMIAAAGLDRSLPLMLVAPLFGGLAFTLYPVCLAHTNDYVRREDMVSASGGLILANSVGATIGPPMASALMATTGPAGLFSFVTGGAACATLYGLWRTPCVRRCPPRHRPPSAPCPRPPPPSLPSIR